MMKSKLTYVVLAGLLCGLSGCGSGSIGGVRGQVTVDGAPAEMGTVDFKPVNDPTGRGAGAAIDAGQFELGEDHRLQPGKYAVSAQLSKSTGKTFNDPQKGPVPVLQPLTLSDSPKEIEVTADNAGQLQIAFTSASK